MLLLVTWQISLLLEEPEKSHMEIDKSSKAEGKAEIHLLATLDFKSLFSPNR